MQRLFSWLWAIAVLAPVIFGLRGPGSQTAPITTVILVRHAEKELVGSDPALTAVGEERAAELARVLRRTRPAAVFASQYRRTQQTVRPLADELGLDVIRIDAADRQGLVETILSEHAGRTVMVAGHSNTLPALIQAFGVPAAPEIGDDDYDDLFIVTVACGGPVRLTHLEYGRP